MIQKKARFHELFQLDLMRLILQILSIFGV